MGILEDAIWWLQRSRDSKSPSTAKLYATALLDEIARLRAREQEWSDANAAWGTAAGEFSVRAEAAEAKAQELENKYEAASEALHIALDQVQALEAALREIIEEFRLGVNKDGTHGGYEEDDPVVIIARRALEKLS